MAVLATTFICGGKHPKFLLGLFTVPAFILLWPSIHTDTDQIRLVIWQTTIQHFTWFGSGPGAMMSAYGIIHGQIFHLEHAHNDYLTYIHQYGLGFLLLAPILVWCTTRTEHREWPTFICLAILSLYFWTLEAPVVAFAFAVVTGRICADTGLAWDQCVARGLGRVLRLKVWSTLAGGAGSDLVPIRLEPKG